MKYTTTPIVLSAVMLLVAIPFAASAHETQRFIINGTEYQFVVGSLNEPIVVDDKTGVDLRVARYTETATGDHGHGDALPAVTGLEETLEVELQAGDATKTLALSPVYNSPGAYKAPFFPTVATTYTYRVFGTLEGTPIDLSFTCSAAGHTEAEEDTSSVEMGENVTRTFKSGAFSCPLPKADMGFPEPSADVVTLSAGTKEEGQNTIGWVAGGLALLALGVAFTRRRS
ncbi:MAG: hypothetical protein WDZ93_01640 [Candidatus Paceibacterota bacterium]